MWASDLSKWINHCSLDKCYQNRFVIQWIVIYSVGSATHPLNKWSLRKNPETSLIRLLERT